MMLSSWIAGAPNDRLKSMKVGNPPVVSAFNLCIVVVGASAKNLNSLQLRDFSRIACVFGMRPLNSASRGFFASPTRKSNRNASITTRTTFGGRCLTQQYPTFPSRSSPYIRMSSQVFRWSSSFLVSRKPEEKRYVPIALMHVIAHKIDIVDNRFGLHLKRRNRSIDA